MLVEIGFWIGLIGISQLVAQLQSVRILFESDDTLLAELAAALLVSARHQAKIRCR